MTTTHTPSPSPHNRLANWTQTAALALSSHGAIVHRAITQGSGLVRLRRQPRERLTDAAFDQEGGARLAADDDFPAVELQPRQKQQVALDWASEREAAVVKSLAL